MSWLVIPQSDRVLVRVSLFQKHLPRYSHHCAELGYIRVFALWVGLPRALSRSYSGVPTTAGQWQCKTTSLRARFGDADQPGGSCARRADSVEEPAWSILTWTWKRDGQTTVHLFKVRPTCNAQTFASITTTAAASKGGSRPGSQWNCGTRALTAFYVIAVMERAFRLECSPPLHGMPPREIPHRASPGAALRTRQAFIRPMVKSSALHRGHAGGAASPGGDAR